MCTFSVPVIVEDWCDLGNEAGISDLQVISMKDLGAQPALDPNSRTLSTDWPLADATVAGWVAWAAEEDTLIHDEASQTSGRVQHTIGGTIPKDSAIKRYIIPKMASGCCKFAVGYTDRNGEKKIITDLKLGYNYTTGLGGDNDDSNQYAITFTKIGAPAISYTGSFLVQTP